MNRINRQTINRKTIAPIIASATIFIASAMPAMNAAAQEASPETTIASTQCSMFYTVQKGDTLSKIARNFGRTIAELQTWNNITNPNRILLGQSLCVGQQVIVDDDAPKTHTVQKGDTLSKIARTYGVQMSVLAKVNNITNVNLIYVGQVLNIPDVTIQ